MSINDHNSVAKLRKTMIYNTNVDLVNDNLCTKFGLILSICFQDIEKKKNRFLFESRAVKLLHICKKMMIYNANVDLVNDNEYIKLALN